MKRYYIYTTEFGAPIKISIVSYTGTIHNGKALYKYKDVVINADSEARAVSDFLKAYRETPDLYTYDKDFKIWAKEESQEEE